MWPCSHRTSIGVMLCDSDDYSVLEVIEGKVIFPAEEAIQEYLETMRRGRNEKS